jgi:ribosomal protein S18 acetylase RimI-like enzyme
MEMTGLSIRPFRPGDERAVIRLWAESGLVVPHNDPAKDVARKYRTHPAGFLVAELDREIVATCMVGYDGHRGWINYLAVSPSRRRRGIATRMMDEAERFLRAAGCPKINLQVRSTNTAVIGFYESLGFRADDVISMGKRLDPDAPFRILQDGTVVPESAE